MDAIKTVGEVLQAARKTLGFLSGEGGSPGLEAQLLLAGLTGRSRSWLLAHPEAALTENQVEAMAERLSRRADGFPLPYLLGEWEFYGLRFRVTPDVMIPRPETELLVEQALAWLADRPGQPRVLDVGTGSGCIATVLALRSPAASVEAVDVSAAALALAKDNARRLGASRIRFYQSDLLDVYTAGTDRFDLICANLPYIPDATLQSLAVGRHEPVAALSGGPDGFVLIRRLLARAPAHLSADGLMLLEIEAGQGPDAVKLAREAFPDFIVSLLQDYAGLDRIVRVDGCAA